MTIEVSDFNIVSKLGQSNAAGEGHIHYYLDAEPPTTPGQPAVSGPGTYAATPEMSHTWQNVTPGSHTLGVQLVNNNHTPLEPPVVARVTVNVEASPQTTEYDNLVENLRTEGATVVPVGEVSQPFFSVTGRVLTVNGEDVQVFEYANIEAASDDAAMVSPDGSSVGTTMISWISDPHFYKSGKLIVIYIGTEKSIMERLESVLGAQFAGRAMAPSPEVSILEPLDGATVPAGDINISIQVLNFTIVSKLGQPIAAGEGHIHYYLDAEPPTTPGQPAVSGPGTYAATPEMSHTWENVTPGSHTLGVQLVNNNHTPLEPPVVAKVAVNVTSSTGQSVTINLSAQNSAFDKNSITVPGGATVTIVFNNMESDYHNFALYQSSAATSAIFVGETIIGPRTINYQFIAPSTPGTYFFRCDVHPTTMTGSFIVSAASGSDGGGGY